MSLEQRIEDLKASIDKLVDVMSGTELSGPEEKPAPKKKAKSKAAEETPEVLIYDDLKAVGQILERDDLIAVLQRLGAKRLSEVNEDQYPKAMKLLKKAQAGEAI